MRLELISNRRLNANRANAKKSSGPKSPAGKQKSAGNAITHGLTASAFVLITEDVEEFNDHRQAYVARFAPCDRVELDLVDSIVHASWSGHRAWIAENETLTGQITSNRTTIAAPRIRRYAASLSNEARDACNMLLDLRKHFPLSTRACPHQQRTAAAGQRPRPAHNPGPQS